MEIQSLVNQFEKRLIIQRYSTSTIRNYKWNLVLTSF